MTDGRVPLEELPVDEQRKVLKRLKRDFWFYCEQAPVMIADKVTTDLVPFIPNYAQRYVWRRLGELARADELVRAVIPKARQEGMTTGFTAEKYHIAATQRRREIYILMHDLQPASKVYKKLDIIHKHVQDAIRMPLASYETGRRMTFENESTLLVESVNKQGVGRSETLHHVHATELPSWDDAQTVLDGIEESVPDIGGGKTSIVLESTCEGVGDHWYWLVQKAREHKGQYHLIFLPWWLEPSYRREPEGDELKRDPLTDEEELIGKRIMREAPLYGMPVPSPTEIVHKLMWRRRKRENRGADKFRQEYPATVDEAFLGSGRPVFRTESVQFHRTRLETAPGVASEADGIPVIRDPSLRMEVYQKGTALDKRGRERRVYAWRRNPTGDLSVWEAPIKGEQYIASADVASGEAEDFSVIQVLRCTPGNGWVQAAVWHGHIGAKELAYVLTFLAVQYNNALMAPENNNEGQTTVECLVNEIRRPGQRLYQYEVLDQETRRKVQRYGFNTGPSTRPAIIEELYNALLSDNITIHHAQTMLEVEQFTRDKKGRPDAPKGAHDDLLVALMIGNYVRSTAPMPRKIDVQVTRSMQYETGRPRTVETVVRSSGVRSATHRSK